MLTVDASATKLRLLTILNGPFNTNIRLTNKQMICEKLSISLHIEGLLASNISQVKFRSKFIEYRGVEYLPIEYLSKCEYLSMIFAPRHFQAGANIFQNVNIFQ